jgi:Xaa-Pro aminopeptidase
VFAERRERFLDAMGPDAVAIVQGASLVTRSADTEYPFRQDSDFWYLTGFGHPDATAVFRTTADAPRYTLFVQPRDRAAETWTGYRPGTEGAMADYGADAAHESGQLLEAMPDLLAGARRIYHAFGRRPALDARVVEIQESLRLHSRRGVSPAADIVDPRSILHEMRLFKSQEELEIMRRAADISREAHHEACQLVAPGRFEYEIEAALDYVFRRRGGSGPAYGSIVAGGANAAILHYVTNDRPLDAGALLLVDAGAELEGYASDVTRTYPVDGRYSGAGKAVYEVVLAAQRAALEAVRPGATLPDIHTLTVRRLVEGMVGVGLLEGDVDDLIAEETYRTFYMHSTSHWLGLDVHDAGSYALDGKPRPLEPGMVFTVEPGVYVARDEERAPEAFRGLGVRIEDNVVVTPDGCEILTASIPTAPADVENWMV